jgi:hypothetical protein
MASGQQEHGSEDTRTLKYSLVSPQLLGNCKVCHIVTIVQTGNIFLQFVMIMKTHFPLQMWGACQLHTMNKCIQWHSIAVSLGKDTVCILWSYSSKQLVLARIIVSLNNTNLIMSIPIRLWIIMVLLVNLQRCNLYFSHFSKIVWYPYQVELWLQFPFYSTRDSFQSVQMLCLWILDRYLGYILSLCGLLWSICIYISSGLLCHIGNNVI